MICSSVMGAGSCEKGLSGDMPFMTRSISSISLRSGNLGVSGRRIEDWSS